MPNQTSQRSCDSAPNSPQFVRFLTAVTIGAVLLVLTGLTLTGTLMGLIIATPGLVVFSPILVPAGIVMFLASAGFLFSGGCGVAAILALSWLYSYASGQQPQGSEQVEYARARIASKARDLKERTKEYGQQKSQETTQTAA